MPSHTGFPFVQSSADDLAEARKSGVSHGLLGAWEGRVANDGQACFSETIFSVSEMLSNIIGWDLS